MMGVRRDLHAAGERVRGVARNEFGNSHQGLTSSQEDGSLGHAMLLNQAPRGGSLFVVLCDLVASGGRVLSRPCVLILFK